MSLVYIFLADGFEEIEGLTSVDLLRRAGVEVKTVSIMDRRIITGARGIPVIADMMFDDMNEEADLLMLPGGMPGTNYLREHEGLAALLKEYDQKEKTIAAICAAPSVFAGLGFLKGRRATSYPGCLEGYVVGQIVTESVVQDGHIITSRGVGTAIDLALALIELLDSREKADEIAASVVYER